MATISEVLKENADELDPSEPATEAELAQATAAIGRALPVELAEFYRAGGFEVALDRVAFFALPDFLDVAKNRKKHKGDHLPSAVFVASDGSDGWFFVDADGALGEGPGAVFWSHRALRTPLGSHYSAPSLADFLLQLLAGKPAHERESLRARASMRLKDATNAARGRVETQPGDEVNIHLASVRLGVALPEELHELLLVSDGMRIKGSTLRIFPCAELEVVAGTSSGHGYPGALWFAEDASARYAVTLSDWREPDGGQVLRVDGRQEPADAPLIGPLPSVVAGWLSAAKGARS